MKIVEIQITSKQAHAIADAVAKFSRTDNRWLIQSSGIKRQMPSFKSTSGPVTATFTTREVVLLQLALETYRTPELLSAEEHRSLQAYLTVEKFTAYGMSKVRA